MKHFHLDPVGGIAGDMFAAALLDLHPELMPDVMAAVRAAGLDPAVLVRHERTSDGILCGSRFVVAIEPEEKATAACAAPAAPAHDHEHAQEHHHEHDHGHEHEHHHHGEGAGRAAQHAHITWATLREELVRSPLSPAVRERALDIFAGLADAEARVHGRPVDEVSFHEVGAWDSIADIVAAAYLIESCGPATWSLGPVPLGSGRVRTAHGLLPVPAPATVLLLEGIPCFDDGRPGERVTPTGAAILRHLAPAAGIGARPRILAGVGHGFGTRRLRGMSNVLRVLAFAADAASDGVAAEEVTVLSFEVDDQTPEDLAVALAHLRACAGVLDVTQAMVVGKRGRQVAAVQLLVRPDAVEAVAATCFAETTTLGLRLARSERRVLEREELTLEDGHRVKRVSRAGVRTAKADIADVANIRGHANRDAARRRAADAALKSDDDAN